jgi:hypothetical protein
MGLDRPLELTVRFDVLVGGLTVGLSLRNRPYKILGSVSEVPQWPFLARYRLAPSLNGRADFGPGTEVSYISAGSRLIRLVPRHLVRLSA